MLFEVGVTRLLCTFDTSLITVQTPHALAPHGLASQAVLKPIDRVLVKMNCFIDDYGR